MKKAYEAIILEEDGIVTDILYKCDKDRNNECKKTNCDKDFCNHTLNKKYAIDYAEKKDIQVIETIHYVSGKPIKKITEYRYGGNRK